LDFCRDTKPRPHYVVVHNVDRWARNGPDHDATRNFLLKLGGRLRSVSQQLGEDPLDQFIQRIFSGQAQLDNQLRGKRSLEGMKVRVQSGSWTFKAPLGYVNGKNVNGVKTLIPDPERAPHITEAFNLFAQGLHTKEQVRVRVNALGLRTMKGKPLSA